MLSRQSCQMRVSNYFDHLKSDLTLGGGGDKTKHIQLEIFSLSIFDVVAQEV